MASADGYRVRLLIAAAASLTLHAAAAVGLGRAQADLRADSPPRLQRPPDPPKHRVTPGIDDSRIATITWMGFERPTPTSAPQADVEQPALAPAPSPAPAPVFPTIQTAPAPRETPRPSSPDSGAPLDAPAPEPSEARAEQTPEGQTTPASTADAPALVEPVPASQEAPPEAPPEMVGPPRPPEPEHSEPAPTAPASDAPSNPAEPSEAESSPYSREKPIDIVLGRPVAREGLKIVTREPRFSPLTSLISRRAGALVEVEFLKSGKVRQARFLEATGNPFVDGPIKNAVYAWRASGKILDDLPERAPDAPPATVTMVFRISAR